MIEVIEKTRLEQLKSLLSVLADAIDAKPGYRDLAQLAKQYRDTAKEIAEITGEIEEDDEIADILASRDASGVANSVR